MLTRWTLYGWMQPFVIVVSQLKAAGEIMDYLTNGIQEGEDDNDDNGLLDEDMDNDEDEGALGNAKMEEAEGYEFDQE